MNLEQQFSDIKNLIDKARQKAYIQVNATLIELYWHIGKHVSIKVASNDWGKSIVADLANYIQKTEEGIQGFSERNIWRMKQFYETYSNPDFLKQPTLLAEIDLDDNQADTILPTLLTQLNWSSHLEIIACKNPEEKLFYLLKAKKEHWSIRELRRQIAASTFERTMLANEKLTQRPHDTSVHLKSFFKDSYVFEFLNLPNQHNEDQLQNAIVSNLKNFILEFGRDFAFMGQEYKLQVGNQDFYIDLLFYHRALQCLVAIELKTERFAPEHLAQINFYLEALDRDVKNSRENPSIGILLCKGKDDVVVEYALSRTLNPAMVADYQLALPSKKILHDKWQEILEMNEKGAMEK